MNPAPELPSETVPESSGPAGKSPDSPFLLLPRPRELRREEGSFPVTRNLTVGVRGEAFPSDGFLREIREWFSRGTGIPVSRLSGEPEDSSSGLVFVLDRRLADLGEEGYLLRISREGIRAEAAGTAGLFYAFQTLRQLLPPDWETPPGPGEERLPLELPAATIRDFPRYPWRGAMLDTVRRFFTVEEVCRYMDMLARYKMNRLHLHLSDDQGFRFSVEALPELTRIGGATQAGSGPGGFYSREDFRVLLAHAEARHILIIPEIDMPGHTNAILASLPSLNPGGIAPAPYRGTEVGFSCLDPDNPLTWEVLDLILTELAEASPAPWIHLGGDEVTSLPAERYREFMTRAMALVRDRGKLVMAYHEAAGAELPPETLIQHWRPDRPDLTREAAARGAGIVLSPADRIYLDMKYHRGYPLGLDWAGTVDVHRSRCWEPAELIPDLPESAVAGVEAPLWTETVRTMADLELLVLPRLAGTAEIGWSSPGLTWEGYLPRLAAQEERWEELGWRFHREEETAP